MLYLIPTNIRNQKQIQDLMNHKCLLILLFSLFVQNSFAQTNEFSHFTVNDGLSQSVVNCILQDSQGYMWLGTQYGLNKFNAYDFEKYFVNPNDTNSLRDSWILSLAEDKNGNIWIGTKKGLHYLDKKTNKVQFVKLKNKNYQSNSEAIYGLCLASSGEIVVNTPPFIHFVNTKTKQVLSFSSEMAFDDASLDQNIPILEAKKGQFWIGSTKGLCMFNTENQKFKHFTSAQSKNTLNSDNISALFVDENKNVWVGNALGLNKIDAKTENVSSYFNKEKNGVENSFFIRSIVQDKNKVFWLGTNGSGLIKFFEKGSYVNLKHSNQATSISHDVVLSLWIDRSENLWLGTLQSADKTDLKPRKFKLYRKSDNLNSVNLLDNVISSIYKQSEERIWLGNWGKGLNIYNRKTGEVEHFSETEKAGNHISNNFVHVIFPYGEEETWLGTRNGIEVYDIEKKRFVLFNHYYKAKNFPDLRNIRINRIIKDKHQNIWLATHSGVFQLNFQENNFVHFSSESEMKISNNQVYTLMEDRQGFIWFATANGLDCYNPKTSKILHYQQNKHNQNSLCDNYTISLCEDLNENIWIGTQSGLNKFSKKDSLFSYFGLEHGIPSKIIYEIILDKLGQLWIATGNGIVVYNSENKSFTSFELSDGLQSLEFNLNAKFQTKEGEIFLGGMNGFNSFYPDSLYKNEYKPQMVFTSFEKKDEKKSEFLNVNSGNEIKLGMKSSSL